MTYSEEDYLLLSGIQHFKFCRRQWALIHIEQQWADNYRTVDGTLMHERAHDTGLKESRGDLFITRGMNFFSSTLGVSGQCDVLEFRRSADGIELKDRDGLWQPYPVEYKRGMYNERTGDTLQLCGQNSQRNWLARSASRFCFCSGEKTIYLLSCIVVFRASMKKCVR